MKFSLNFQEFYFQKILFPAKSLLWVRLRQWASYNWWIISVSSEVFLIFFFRLHTVVLRMYSFVPPFFVCTSRGSEIRGWYKVLRTRLQARACVLTWFNRESFVPFCTTFLSHFNFLYAVKIVTCRTVAGFRDTQNVRTRSIFMLFVHLCTADKFVCTLRESDIRYGQTR